MESFVMRRILSVLPVLFGISLLTFGLSFLAPGDPAELMLDQTGTSAASAEEIAAMREKMGLDEAWYVQYGMWLSHIVQGDAGTAWHTGNSVWQEIERRLPVTVTLAFCALAWAGAGGVALGILVVFFRGSLLGHVLSALIHLLLSTPSFLLAIALILIVGETWGILPTSGIEKIEGYILPSMALSLVTLAMTSQLLSSRLHEELGALYCKVASARGLSSWRVLVTYALPNALLPVLALLGNYFGAVLGGSVIVESVFALPGIGSLAMEAIRFRDYPLLQGYVFLTGTIFVFVSLGVDLLAYYLDPRTRFGRSS